MPPNLSLMRPEDCALVLVDLQAGLAFGVGSEDRQVLLNNAVALARTARVFGIPVVASTSASKVYSGPMCRRFGPRSPKSFRSSGAI